MSGARQERGTDNLQTGVTRYSEPQYHAWGNDMSSDQMALRGGHKSVELSNRQEPSVVSLRLKQYAVRTTYLVHVPNILFVVVVFSAKRPSHL